MYPLCIPGLFPLPRVHLKVDQRVQRNNFPKIHLNVHRCTSGFIPRKFFLWTLWSENCKLSWSLCIFIVKHSLLGRCYILVVTWALMICLICMPTALGLWVYISGKITRAHVTTITYISHMLFYFQNTVMYRIYQVWCKSLHSDTVQHKSLLGEILMSKIVQISCYLAM